METPLLDHPFALPNPQGDTSVTIEIPFFITVIESSLGGGFFAGGGFARQAGVAEVATAQPTPAMWMAFMGACMSVMLVSVVILAWFAYAVVGARAAVPAAKYVAVEPRFAASA